MFVLTEVEHTVFAVLPLRTLSFILWIDTVPYCNILSQVLGLINLWEDIRSAVVVDKDLIFLYNKIQSWILNITVTTAFRSYFIYFCICCSSGWEEVMFKVSIYLQWLDKRWWRSSVIAHVNLTYYLLFILETWAQRTGSQPPAIIS